MTRERLVIIGGVAAGMSTASRARKLRAELEIIVLEKGRHISYGTCGLPYYLSGQIADWKELIVYDAEFFRERRGIDVRLEHEVTEIEPARKMVRGVAEGTRDFALPYDKLVITTGGAPAETFPGADASNVFTCNDLAGTIRLREFVERERPKRAVIVGSGYIGLEVADAFVRRGIAVSILERSNSVLEGVEPEVGGKVEAELYEHGVELIKNSAVSEIECDEERSFASLRMTNSEDRMTNVEKRAVAVRHGSSGRHEADLVLLATGIVPRVGLAESAGIQLGPTGAIAVDERMLTGVNSIYAAGDCTEVRHLVSGKPSYIPLGTTANKQGRVAGENAAGGNARFPGVVGTLVTQVFELEVARTGLSVEQARGNGFQPDAVTITSTSRAKYFHGKPILVKLVWDRTSGRVLGAQMCGKEGVAKRIDAAAMALQARMRVPELLYSDLSYAPPFAPVWEPILIAANEAMKRDPSLR
jgi:NADPH-dependent 2,4-dienoyl-CoA reductase/sulfur reductase-like enzyme